MKIAKTKYKALRVDSGLKEFTDLILANSWIKQPDLALGGALSLFAVLASRKFIYQGLAPNLYIANISPSGTGKSFPQEEVRKALVECGGQDLIGAGDYASYAAIMDTLSTKPIRLDILDEMGGILKTINSGGDDYTSKMDDILAELYTTSNSFYAGRALAEGIKGQCFRPNVNILGSTTPQGFEEGVTQKAIDKGLLGRFLFFMGDKTARANRVHNPQRVSAKLQQHLCWLTGYKAEENHDLSIKGIEQSVTELEADKQADQMLDIIFKEFDDLRINNQNNSIGPIVARLYQQMIKLVIIHAISRNYREIPTINKDDVLFGYESIMLQYSELDKIVSGLVFSSKEEKNRHYVLNTLKESGTMSKKQLVKATPKLSRNIRHFIVEELKELGAVAEDTIRLESDKFETTYNYIGEL